MENPSTEDTASHHKLAQLGHKGVRNIHGQEDTRSILEDTQLIFGRYAVNIWKIRG